MGTIQRRKPLVLKDNLGTPNINQLDKTKTWGKHIKELFHNN